MEKGFKLISEKNIIRIQRKIADLSSLTNIFRG